MIQLPPSKSIGARYLVATYFAGTLPAQPYFEDCNDLRILQEALLEIYSDEEPIDYGDSPVDLGDSGTALRFVTAVCASSQDADYVITGTPRLMQRPMLPLINVLKAAGSEVNNLGADSAGPYRVKGCRIEGGEFEIKGDVSSQFISALMLVAPAWKKGIKLNFSTPLVSRPYIEMTKRMLEKFAIKVILTDRSVEVSSGRYLNTEHYAIEADWSSASFFYEACALGGKKIELGNLLSPSQSLQGDAAADEIFGELGVKSIFSKSGAILNMCRVSSEKIEVDFNDFPDIMLPVAVACLFKGIKFRFNNITHLRFKESDRVRSLTTEARKFGFEIKEGENFLEWNGEQVSPAKSRVIETYNDHRVAMSFAMAAITTGEIKISHPEVVEKSFVDFWNQLQKLGLQCSQEGDVMTVVNPELIKNNT